MATFYQLCDYFEFLDDLRLSGSVNMFGAGSHLEGRFDLDKREARAVVMQWQNTFSDEPLEERVYKAQQARVS